MSVTDSDAEQAATATVNDEAPDGPPAFQVARTRDGQDSGGTANEPGTHRDAPWSMRAGEGIRKGASATVSHPRTWGIWDQHPASLRVICTRKADSASAAHPSILVRWPATAAWLLVIA